MLEVARMLLAGETVLVLGLMMVITLSWEHFKRWEFACLQTFTLGLLVWIGGIFLQLFMPTDVVFAWGSLEFFSLQALNLATTLFLFAQYGFARLYRKPDFRLRWYDYVLVFGFAFTQVLSLGKNTINSSITFLPNGNADVVPGPWEVWFSVFTLLLITSSVATLAMRFFKTENRILKKQFAYMFWGCLVFNVSGVLTNWILPAYFDFALLDFAGPLFFVVMAAYFYAAVHMTRFPDLRLLLHRYSAFTGNLALYSLGLWAVMSYSLPRVAIELWVFWWMLVMGACYFAWPHSYALLDRVLNYLLFQKKTNLLEDLEQSLTFFDQSVQAGVKHLTNILGVQRAELVLVDGDFMKAHDLMRQFFNHSPEESLIRDEIHFKLGQKEDAGLSEIQSQMDDLMLAAAVPVLGKDKNLLGVLLLEQKVDGKLFSSQEMKGLKRLLGKATIFMTRERDYTSMLDKLRKKSSVKKEFLDGLMHEIRHPLMMARNVAEMIDWAKLRPEDQAFLHDSQSSLTDLSHKLDRVALAAQWQAGKMPLSPSWNNLEDLSNYLENNLKSPNSFVFKLDEALKSKLFRFDLGALQKACLELIQNGLRFNKSKRPKVCLLVEAEGDDLKFSFTDNGVGIDPGRWEKLFDLMVVEDTARNEALSGVGAGLTLASGIAESHGGSVKIISSSAKGTTVELCISLEVR